MDKAHRELSFPPFHISTDVDLLYSDEKVVPLEPNAARVLRYLAENHTRVVSKEELLEKVWSGVFTTDDVLKKAVSQIRRALGDDPEKPQFIRTFHRRGYQFIGEVAVKTDEELRRERDAKSEQKSFDSTKNRLSFEPDFDQLVGRETSFAALTAEFKKTLNGTGQALVLIGEPGVGKTQLARRFKRWVREHDADCFYTRFFDYGGSRLAPFENFLDLLRLWQNQAKNQDGKEIDLRLFLQKQLGASLPESLFVDSTGEQAAGAPNSSDYFRAIVPLSDCFVRASRLRPMVLILDDAQWADEPNLNLIGYLMRAALSEKLLLIVITRAEDAAQPTHPFAAWLQTQAVYRSFTTLNLKPLETENLRAAIESYFGGKLDVSEIPEKDLRTLSETTGGNPYFLVETLRLMMSEGIIKYDATEKRWQWNEIKNLRLPESITMATRAKIARLTEDVRRILENASVIGDEFRVETLALMTGEEEDKIEDLLEISVKSGVLSSDNLQAGEDYRFFHTTLRRVLYEDLPRRRKTRFHARAAVALENVYARDADRIAEAISSHAEQGEDWRRAFDWAMRAFQAASSRWNWTQAVADVERAARAAEELESAETQLSENERLQLLLAQGEAYFSVGKLKEAENLFARAGDLAQTLVDDSLLALTLLLQGQVRNNTGSYREAVAPLEYALQLYREANDANGIVQVLLQLGSVQFALGNYETSVSLTEQALKSGSISPFWEAVALGKLGWAHALQGRFAEGRDELERALEYQTRAGDVRQRIVLLRCLNYAAQGLGDYEKAIEYARQARDIARSIGDVSGEGKANFRLGKARIAQGLYDEGIEYLNRTLENLKSIGDAHCEAETFWILGQAQTALGNSEKARALFDRALKMVRDIGDRDDEMKILIDRARLEIVEKNFSAALMTASQAVEIARELNSFDGLGAGLAEKSRAALALGRRDEALAAAQNSVEMFEKINSGESWRGLWALAASLSETDKTAAIDFMRRAVEQINKMRAQIADESRKTLSAKAFSAPFEYFYNLLVSADRLDEAEKFRLDCL